MKRLQQLTKKKELLEDYKKGIMQKIFSQEIRFKDDNGNNYPDWERKKFRQMVEIQFCKRDKNIGRILDVPFLELEKLILIDNKLKHIVISTSY